MLKSMWKRSGGFTLIELLIVIAIIGVLAGLALKAISSVQESASQATTTSQVAAIANALESYLSDEGALPGASRKNIDEDDNLFPELFNALLDEKKPKGKGGRSAPYLDVKEDDVHVWDDDIGEYRKAKRSERFDNEVDKFIVDSWGQPLVYRPNKGKRRQPWMHNPSGADIYSVGSDGEDQTKEGSDDSNDDIGNW